MTRTPLVLAGALLAGACSTGKTSDTTGFSGASSESATAGSGTASTSSGSSSGSGSSAGSGSGSSGSTSALGSSGTGGSSTGGSSTGSGSTGSGSTGGSLMCTDANEPNESESNAKGLGIIDDCDGSGSSVSGQLEGANDVDWFSYSASDVFGCVVDPSRNVISSGSVRFCKFIDCASGTADISSCPGGAFSSTSPGGHPGCCKVGSNLSNFDLSIDCSGTDDSAQVLMRVDQGPAGVCTTYTIDYHY